jgi:uncharacterized phiE125 gp8 family phage protein
MIDCTVLRSRWSDWPVRVGVKVIDVSPDPVLPLTVLRQHLELVAIDGTSDDETHPDDDLILGFLAAAVDYAEDYTGLSILERTLEMGLDIFPRNAGGVAMKRPPVIEILSFTGADGSDGEMDSGDHYTLDDYSNPPMLFPISTWPTVTRTPNLIKIRYRAGFRREGTLGDSDDPGAESDAGSGAKPLPKGIRAALLLMLGHLYENRSDSVEKAMASIPLGVNALLGMKRIETSFA